MDIWIALAWFTIKYGMPLFFLLGIASGVRAAIRERSRPDHKSHGDHGDGLEDRTHR